jgi:hypothetical protein
MAHNNEGTNMEEYKEENFDGTFPHHMVGEYPVRLPFLLLGTDWDVANILFYNPWLDIMSEWAVPIRDIEFSPWVVRAPTMAEHKAEYRSQLV